MKYTIFSKSEPIVIISRNYAETKWTSAVKKYYEKLGYEYTGYLKTLTVLVEHLKESSNVKVFVLCPLCKQERKVPYSNIKKYGHTYCINCSQKYDLRNIKFGKLLCIKYLYVDKNRHSIWECKCDCGNITKVSSNSLSKGNTESCGCYAKEVASSICSKRVGKNHPNWNSNKTKEERENDRDYKEYRDFRNLVFNRDLHICRLCESKGGDLVVHHLYDYSTYKDRRTDPNNGITLCIRCHDLFHNWMGGNHISCTKSDFLKFITEYLAHPH